MCGIAGIFEIRAGNTPSRRDLEAMIGRLRHRGPDGTGVFVDGPAGLAHARLSIIDIQGGGQPIHNEDRSVWVVLNGEIFNFLELRADLERLGHCFYTHSDTEVIVHLYEVYGEEFVAHLNGQFAIALWDGRNNRLLLVRDRVGIRPLFFVRRDERLVFASEIKAIFALPGMPRALDVHALNQVCTYWSPIAGRTAFEGVESLPPGHLMVVDAQGQRIRRYWDWHFPDAVPDLARSEEDYADELRSLLVESVRLQLRADVPVGAYLSGGLDSSLVASLIRNFTETPLRTFSLTFADDEFDESPFQNEMAHYLGTEHSAVRCTRAEIAAAFPRTIWHAEVPIVRTAPTPLMGLSGHVREAGYKVVLTGEGADEVFGGYDLFKEAKVRRFVAKAPQSAWRSSILQRLYPYLKNSPAGGRAFTAGFFLDGLEHIASPCFAHLPRWTTTSRIRQFFSRAVLDEVGCPDPKAVLEASLPKGIERWLPLGRDQYVEAHTLLSGYLLSSQGDRVAMANSVEGRYPFLDHRLIEFANQLPPWLKIRGLTEKYLLKKAASGLLPETIRRRTKQPYRAPDSQSFFEDGKPVDYVAELFAEGQIRQTGYFDPKATAKLYEKCRSGRAIGFADNMAFVAILSTMLLHRHFIEENAAPVG